MTTSGEWTLHGRRSHCKPLSRTPAPAGADGACRCYTSNYFEEARQINAYSHRCCMYAEHERGCLLTRKWDDEDSRELWSMRGVRMCCDLLPSDAHRNNVHVTLSMTCRWDDEDDRELWSTSKVRQRLAVDDPSLNQVL